MYVCYKCGNKTEFIEEDLLQTKATLSENGKTNNLKAVSRVRKNVLCFVCGANATETGRYKLIK